MEIQAAKSVEQRTRVIRKTILSNGWVCILKFKSSFRRVFHSLHLFTPLPEKMIEKYFSAPKQIVKAKASRHPHV